MNATLDLNGSVLPIDHRNDSRRGVDILGISSGSMLPRLPVTV
jgi:hypothetical protein